MEVQEATSVQVVEVHDWPERAVVGPTICVWYGTDAAAADICAELEARRKQLGHRYRYEVRGVV